MTTLLDQSFRTARKRHQCNWCLHPIDVGTVYVSQAIVDGCGFWQWKAHAECGHASRRLDRYELENSGHLQFTRGCSCEAGGHADYCGAALVTYEEAVAAIARYLAACGEGGAT